MDYSKSMYANRTLYTHVNVVNVYAMLQNTFSLIFDLEAGDVDDNNGYDLEGYFTIFTPRALRS